MIAESWEGLHDLGEIEPRIAELDGSRVVTAQLEAERRAEDFEAERVRRLSAVLQEYEADGPPGSSQLALADLRIVDLQERAAEDSPTGTAARRVLEWIFTRISFYMKRDWFERGRHAQAAVLLEVATGIHPNAPQVWYDLARAYSRAGSGKKATAALHRALDEGFHDLAAMQAEADLQPIRSTTGYAQATARLSSPAGGEPAVPR
jgi:tetratricopeptide (TPR) repeat protein